MFDVIHLYVKKRISRGSRYLFLACSAKEWLLVALVTHYNWYICFLEEKDDVKKSYDLDGSPWRWRPVAFFMPWGEGGCSNKGKSLQYIRAKGVSL